MIEKLLFVLILSALIVGARYIGLTKIKANKGDDFIQRTPKSIDLVFWLFVVLTLFLGLLFIVLMFQEKSTPKIVTGVLTLLFIGITIYLKLAQLKYSYQETADHFTIKTVNKEITMNYDDIVKWSQFKENLFVWDSHGKATINMMWFRPTTLIKELLKLHDEDRFDYKTENQKEVARQILEDLRQSAYRQ